MEKRKNVIICITLGILLFVGQVKAAAINFQEASQPEFSISISSTLPTGEAFSNGFIILELSIPIGMVLQNDIIVYLDGVEKYSFKMFPTTLQIPTEGLEDGSHTVSIVAISRCNKIGYGEIVVLVQDPHISVVSIDYPKETYPGATITITIEISGSASHFVANFTALFGVTTLTTSSVQSGAFLTGTTVVPSGLSVEERIYPIPLVVHSNDGRTLMVPRIEIFFQAGQTNPFSIEEGIIDMQSFPTAAATDSTLVLTLPTNFEISITTGQSVEIPIEVDNPDANEVLVGFGGYGQHFIIPISSLQNQNTNQRRSTRQVDSGTQMLSFMIQLPASSLNNGDQVMIQMRLRSNDGEFGEVETFQCTTSTSQQGTLYVRLTWYLEVDMDLHVIDPNGEEIYYGNTMSSGQEGFLDLDSNPACNFDYIKIENIYYPLAISGQYTVRVDLWDNCGETEQIHFMVKADGCGVSPIPVLGFFEPSEADAGGAGSGREVLVFEAECDSYIVDGTISYRTLMSRANPLGSIIRVVDDQGTVYGSSQVVRDVTDSNQGIYSVSYEPNNVNTPVYVEFLSSNYKIEVTDHDDDVHVYRDSNSIIPSTEPSAIRDVTILLSESSGAFHIMVTLTRMLPTYLAYGGSTMDYPRKANWELGRYARNANGPVSYFSPSTGIISIGGHPMDPDEFDDSVLLHEFGHLTMFRTGAKITGGGPHDGSPIPPNFAFSEGYATYLGQRVIGNLIYCDGSWCLDISILNLLTLGTTRSDHSSGYISEWVVASAAFRLDTENGLGGAMALALHSQDKLLLTANYNRLGTLTAVDFSDMVSITVCPLVPTRRTMAANLLNEYSLPWISEMDFCT